MKRLETGLQKQRNGRVRDLFFLLGVFFLLSSCLGPRGLEVDFSDSRLVQGGLALLHIMTPGGDEPIRGTFKGGKTVLIRSGRHGAWAILAADLAAEPGTYYLTFRQGPKEISSSIRIVTGEFKTARIHLPRKMVEFDEKTLARIAVEKRRLSKVFASSAPTRLWKRPFVMPLRGRISGEFGERRVLNGRPRSPHSGLDIAAPLHTPVRAAGAGRVAFTGDFFFYGRFVVIDHGLGLFTLYAHLDRVLVKNGDTIERGRVIGLVGATGRATGPHLHFGVTIEGMGVSPEEFIPLSERLVRLMRGRGKKPPKAGRAGKAALAVPEALARGKAGPPISGSRNNAVLTRNIP